MYNSHEMGAQENMSRRGYGKWIYILLALCLGSTGIQNFYSGNYVIGILWFLLFLLGCILSLIGIGWLIIGFLWLIAFLQAIIALCRHADEYGNIGA